MGRAAREHLERVAGAYLLIESGIGRGWPVEELIAALRRAEIEVRRVDRRVTLGQVSRRQLSGG